MSAMLDQIIRKLVAKQRPYYQPQGKPIQGTHNQLWLIFENIAQDNSLSSLLLQRLSVSKTAASHKVIRIDTRNGEIFYFVPQKKKDIPSTTLFRTAAIDLIEKFFTLEYKEIEDDLIEGSFLQLEDKGKRRYNLPKELDEYNEFFKKALSRSALYRRSSGYFDSGVLKIYEEPLQEIIRSEGNIQLLVDWMGFTNKRDLDEMDKLQDPNYRNQFLAESLEAFLQGLDESKFTSTEIMAELIRLGILDIRVVKMDEGKAIYHKKTGIFTDHLGHHIMHEGSDNFTRAAHSRNAESMTFMYSVEGRDAEIIQQSIEEFDGEWNDSKFSHTLSNTFLDQVKKERARRDALYAPQIESINPNDFKAGESTPIRVKGKNLDQVDSLEVEDDDLVKITIDEKTPDEIKADITVAPDHPSRPIKIVSKKGDKTYPANLKKEPKVKQSERLESYAEISGFKEAVKVLMAGDHGTPKDFLYWLGTLRPHQFKLQASEILDEMVDDGILFEHQKSGALHCARVMADFGVAVCADAVGLGKTRLAAAVAKISTDTKPKIAVVASKKLQANWIKEMEILGFSHERGDFELYNKNLMGRKGSFIDDFNRYGGPDLIIIDEAHEGIRNFGNRIHKTCLQIKEKDQKKKKQRHYLLLTATPWNNRREDIYNILTPFLTKTQGFSDIGLEPVKSYFEDREHVELFIDNTPVFRRVYKELFLQRTRAMLKEAYPALNLYAKRVAKWLPVQFEEGTEQALDQIFQSFEEDLHIPFANPIRYFGETPERHGLPNNMRRFFLQRAESSMYALKRTISNFQYRLKELQDRLTEAQPTPDGLRDFLLSHYKLENYKNRTDQIDPEAFPTDDSMLDEDEFDEDEDELDTNERDERLLQLIENAIESVQDNPDKVMQIRTDILNHCQDDWERLEAIKDMLGAEFVKDHKREEVTKKVKELIRAGEKVLLISTFADSVLDYYSYMSQDELLSSKGIGMAMGGRKVYYPDRKKQLLFTANNITKAGKSETGISREQLFKKFAPAATCRKEEERPSPEDQLSVLIGSETLSVGQNLQDADVLINIDLPWNPMILEQRIGRIDRPKQHRAQELQIYYANSESQLLRQASRLENLHQKLMGDARMDSSSNGSGSNGNNREAPFRIQDLGPSIYGDTFFDDEVLPGYIDFIKNLRSARKIEQGSLQEKIYENQEVYNDLITHLELLYGEDVSKQLREMGENYPVNPITLGRNTGQDGEPTAIVGLRIQRFGPNGELIDTVVRDILLWNDVTQDKGAFGKAMEYGVKTPEAGTVFSSEHIKNTADLVYKKLLEYKQFLEEKEVVDSDNLSDITITSERMNTLVSRIKEMQSLPEGVTRERVVFAIESLSAYKDLKPNRKLLKDLTGKSFIERSDHQFILDFLNKVESKNLIRQNVIKTADIKLSLEAILLRA